MDSSIYQAKADVLKALAHPTRLKILEFLRDGEQCVCDIMDNINIEQSNASQHLALLKKMDILSSKKEGLKVIYRVKNDDVFIFLNMLASLISYKLEENISVLNSLKKNSEK